MKKIKLTGDIAVSESDTRKYEEAEVELNRLTYKELPKLNEQIREIKTGEYWTALEILRKAEALQIDVAEAKTRVNSILAKIENMKREVNSKLLPLENLIREMSKPIVKEAWEAINRAIVALEAKDLRVLRLLGKQQVFVERGDTERVVWVYRVSTNVYKIGQARELLEKLKGEVNGMSRKSPGAIVEKIAQIESEVNRLLEEVEEIEMSRTAYREAMGQGD
jgi:uncharacterized protein YoxC